MRRIHVVGTSGSGKTTLARELSRRLDVPHIELDALHWQAGWTERPRDELIADLRDRLDAPGWVVDGNYTSVATEHVWPHVDKIVWLDLPKWTVMRQVFHRTLRRWWRQEELWNGNRESLRTSLFTRNSILYWAWVSRRSLRE